MSFFMVSMPDAGLMSRPPVSKHTPLPTRVSFGARAGHGEFPAQALARHDAQFGPMLEGYRTDGLFELVRPHIG
jgi:hypothetical protein